MRIPIECIVEPQPGCSLSAVPPLRVLASSSARHISTCWTTATSASRDRILTMSILTAFSRRRPAVDLGHRFALIDVETTGLNSSSDRVVQVAVRQLDPVRRTGT